jgi:hypothetical protein
MKFFRGVCILALVCTFVSCDAPRINPLDPESPDYKYFTLEGTVKAKSTQLPLGGVKVSWKNSNQNISVLTDNSGNYILNRLERTDGIIYFEKDLYSKDTSLVKFNGSKIIQLDDQLNAMPRLGFFNLYTSVENRYPDYTIDTLIVRASIFDEEGDIDSVAIQNRSINFYKKLPFDISTQLYRAQFLATDLNISSILEAQGTAFELVAFDNAKRKFIVTSQILTRIINQEVFVNSPSNGDIYGSNGTIIFDWNKFEPRFDFTYTIQIYPVTPPEGTIPVWERKKISSFDTKYTLSLQSLLPKIPPGSYYWVIWAKDNFGNGTKSKPATFVIQ